MNREKALVWFRRDLRDHDHAALSAALTQAGVVYCAFVFDTDILAALGERRDRRMHFIRESLVELDAALRLRGGGLIVRHGRAVEEIPALGRELGVAAVFANRDYEPAAKLRDGEVGERLSASGIAFHTLKDQAIFDGDDVLTQAGKPYTVFTPYKNAWLKRLTAIDHAEQRGAGGQLAMAGRPGIPPLRELGFEATDLAALGIAPGMRGARARWAERPQAYAAWCAGRTGYPLVDAAMRQLNARGWMHNRLRMVVASFLTKDLGIDWRLGERYFAERLIDFDLAANNGGWQWAASSGCDAQPWFRIFNPLSQSEKFDPAGRFIRRYLPELAAVPDRLIHAPWKMGRLEQEAIGVVIGRDYPAPIVDHATAREETLARYSVVRKATAA